MKQIDLISSEWLDLVFEGRNTEYGAYVLRQQTGKRNVLAMVALGVFVLLVSAVIFGLQATEKYRAAHTKYDEEVILVNLRDKQPATVEHIEKPKEPERVVENLRNSIKFVAPRIIKDEDVRPEDMMRSQDELNQTTTAIAAVNVTNGSDDGVVARLNDIAAQIEPRHEEVEEKVEDIVEQMPMFPGGNNELMQYLGKNIKYPVVCQESGVQGRVICAFIVEKDGSITDVHIVRSVDPNLDKEALRVIKSMPKWIPGRQNGRAVRVKFNVPVTFRLQ